MKRIQLICDFQIHTDHPTPQRRSELALINKKEIYHRVDFAVLADPTHKMKESEKIDKRAEKLWNKVSVIPIVVGALETVLKGLNKDWRNWKSEKESRLFWPQCFWDKPESLKVLRGLVIIRILVKKQTPFKIWSELPKIPWEFFAPAVTDSFHWNSSDYMFLQFFKALLNILVDLSRLNFLRISGSSILFSMFLELFRVLPLWFKIWSPFPRLF